MTFGAGGIDGLADLLMPYPRPLDVDAELEDHLDHLGDHGARRIAGRGQFQPIRVDRTLEKNSRGRTSSCSREAT